MSHDRHSNDRHPHDREAPTAAVDRDTLDTALKTMRPTAALPVAPRRLELDDTPTERSDEHALQRAIAADLSGRAHARSAPDRRPARPPIPGFDVTDADSGPTLRNDEGAVRREIAAAKPASHTPAAGTSLRGPTGFDVTDPESGPTHAVDRATFERELQAEIQRRDEAPGRAASPAATEPVSWEGPVRASTGRAVAALPGSSAGHHPGPLSSSPQQPPHGPTRPKGPGAVRAMALESPAESERAARGLRAHLRAIQLTIAVVGMLFLGGLFGIGEVAVLTLPLIGLQLWMAHGFWRFGSAIARRSRAGRFAQASVVCWALSLVPTVLAAVTLGLTLAGLASDAVTILAALGVRAILAMVLASPFLALLAAVFGVLALARTAEHLDDAAGRKQARQAAWWGGLFAAYLVLVPILSDVLFAGVSSVDDAISRAMLAILTGFVLGVGALATYLSACKAVVARIDPRGPTATPHGT